MSNWTQPVETIEIDPNAGTGSNGPVPAGRWDVAVQDVRQATSQRGATYYQITFEIYPGLFSGQENAHLGRYIYDKEPWVMAMILKALGYDKVDADGKIRVGAQSIIGQMLVIDLGYKPSPDGTKQWPTISKVYHPDDAPAPDPVEEEVPFNAADEPLFASATAAAQQAVATGSLAGH